MRRHNYLLKTLTSLILGLPLVAARNTGFEGLDKGIEMISRLFYPSILQTNENVQVGFFKFLYFIIIFAAANWVLTSFVFKSDKADAKNSKRAANTIAFSFAAISAWFMPRRVALGTAGLITAIFNSLVILGIVAGAVYLAYYVFKGEKGWWEHLLGAAVILVAIIIVSWFMGVLG